MLFSQITRKNKQNTSIYLYMYHFAKSGLKPFKLMRRLRDKEENCPFDNVAGLKKNSLQLTDLNRDQYAEITFVYELGCKSGMDPNPVKLVTLERGKKYIIRGTTKVGFAGDMDGGERKIDPSFLKAPNEFLNHALVQWERHTVVKWGSQ